MAFDDIVLEPIAKGYNKLPVPSENRYKTISHQIYLHCYQYQIHYLQGDIKQVGHATGSFLINSTVGVLGILNPAEKMGLKPRKEDVGQTLVLMELVLGCYFVLPILGPTTARDSLGLLLIHL